jgi:hypothetical protein
MKIVFLPTKDPLLSMTGLLCYHEDGGSVFGRNISNDLPGCTALLPRQKPYFRS